MTQAETKWTANQPQYWDEAANAHRKHAALAESLSFGSERDRQIREAEKCERRAADLRAAKARCAAYSQARGEL